MSGWDEMRCNCTVNASWIWFMEWSGVQARIVLNKASKAGCKHTKAELNARARDGSRLIGTGFGAGFTPRKGDRELRRRQLTSAGSRAAL
jgi:hypothetical protein